MHTRWQVLHALKQVKSPRSLRRVSAAVGLGSLFVFALMTAIAAAQEQQISSEAWKQMCVMLDEKASRTSAQQKISSRLLEIIKGEQGRTGQPKESGSRTGREIQPDGTILVDIQAHVTDALLQDIKALGGTIINSFPQYQAIRAQVPIAQLETLAASPDVKSIRPADTLQLHR